MFQHVGIDLLSPLDGPQVAFGHVALCTEEAAELARHMVVVHMGVSVTREVVGAASAFTGLQLPGCLQVRARGGAWHKTTLFGHCFRPPKRFARPVLLVLRILVFLPPDLAEAIGTQPVTVHTLFLWMAGGPRSSVLTVLMVAGEAQTKS